MTINMVIVNNPEQMRRVVVAFSFFYFILMLIWLQLASEFKMYYKSVY